MSHASLRRGLMSHHPVSYLSTPVECEGWSTHRHSSVEISVCLVREVVQEKLLHCSIHEIDLAHSLIDEWVQN